MRLFLTPLVIAIICSVGIDVYIIWQLKKHIKSRWPRIIATIISALVTADALAAILIPHNGGNDAMLAVMWTLYCFMSVFIAQVVFFLLDLISRIKIKKFTLRWLRPVAIVTAVATLSVMIWASAISRYNLDVRHVTVEVENLPPHFENYRIVQLSDVHVAAYGNDTTFIAEIVDSVNALSPDLICFTGDLVSMRTDELVPHAPVLSRLHARDGVLSILGNHDYGDYVDWNDPLDKVRSHAELIDMQRCMGWDLLLDEHRIISREGDSIAVIGVQNIGRPPFPAYGSLEKAYPTVGDSVTKILLSHNPNHWNDSINNNSAANIALTLSGHTHAMQIKVGGFSPSKWIYTQWGGLYKSITGQQIYVNIGTGTVGFPARIGATPEITLITLKRKH